VHHVPVAADLADYELATSLAASAEPGVLDRLATIAANARALAAAFTPGIAATSFGFMKDPNVLILHAHLPATASTAEPGHRPFQIDITARSPERAHT